MGFVKLIRFGGRFRLAEKGPSNAKTPPVLPAGFPAEGCRPGSNGAATLTSWLTNSTSRAKRCATGVKQTDLDAGTRSDGLTTEARAESSRLRRACKRLTIENAILSRAAAWFARETNSIPDKRSNS